MSEKQVNPLIEELADKRRRALENRRRLVAETELTLAFLSGQQWVNCSQSEGLVPVANDAEDLRRSDNVMLNAYRRWLFYLFKERPVITAFEGGNELRDAETAAVAAKLCDFWESNNGWRESRRELMAWVGVSGIGWIAPVWRRTRAPRKGRKLEYTAEPTTDRRGRKSHVIEREVDTYDADIAFEVFNPLQTFTFPLDAPSWSKVTGVLTVDVATIEWIAGQLGQKLDEAELTPVSDEDVNVRALERVNRLLTSEFRLTVTDPQQKRYLIEQWFERPSATRPNGRYVLEVGGKVLRDEDLPYVAEARSIDPGDVHNLTMGLVPCFSMPWPWGLEPPAPIGELRPAQISINELLTDEYRNRRTVGRNKLLIEQNAIDREQWTGEHGEMIEVRPGSMSFPPQFIQGQPLVGLSGELERAYARFEEMTGQTSVLRGQNPPNARAAFQLDILRNESMTLVYADVEQSEQCYELTARLALAIAKKRYTQERIIQVYGRDRAGDAITFKTAVINADVRVKQGSMQPRNHALREAKLTELLQYGAFIDPVTGKPNMDLFWQMSELGTMNRRIDAKNAAQSRAHNESKAMLLNSEPIEPYEHQDHDTHIAAHLRDMERDEFYDADEAIRALLITHVETHRRMLSEQLAPDAFTDPDPVAGLVPGGAGAPAGSPAAPGAARPAVRPPGGM